MATKYFCYCIGGTGARVAEVPSGHLEDPEWGTLTKSRIYG